MSVANPVDVKWTTGDNVYVLSRSTATITEFSTAGMSVRTVGSSGNALGQFYNPSGIITAADGSPLVVDTGNNRLVQFLASEPYALYGSQGTAPGQYSAPLNVALQGPRVYVADTGNNRIQALDSSTFNPVFTISSELGLSQPNSVSAANDAVQERIYIADTGNNRVIEAAMPKVDPLASCWNPAK
jgi:hypothetical protein